MNPTEVTKTLQQTCLGDRNIFIFDSKESFALIPVENRTITNYLVFLYRQGYLINNIDKLQLLSGPVFEQFINEFNAIITTNTKTGTFLRKTFASEMELTPYTEEEINYILAQYSLTYGWTDEFKDMWGEDPTTIFNAYNSSLNTKNISTVSNNKLKRVTIGNKTNLVAILLKIMESKTVLRPQQITILNEAPIDALKATARYATIYIKETLIRVALLLKDEKLDFPLLRTPTDVVRLVAANYTKGDTFEGQLTKTALANLQLHIPTSARKRLLNNLELMYSPAKTPQQAIHSLCEDMLKFSSFWKRLDRYLSYESMEKKRVKYPLYTDSIDLLYSGDTSWTFNSRYEEAKKRGDYKQAFIVMTEKPSLLLRNLLEFMRMTKGKRIPSKTKQTKYKLVHTDALDNMNSKGFKALLERQNNRKILWQILEQLNNKTNYKDCYERFVQGQKVEYATPIPGLDYGLITPIENLIVLILRANSPKRVVYIDPSADGYKLQYSGRKNVSTSLSGEFIPPGTKLPLQDILNKKGINSPVLRLGVMWKGKISADIDHSATLNTGFTVYFGEPEYRNNIGDLAIISSGDITSCTANKFSTEFIDIDIAKLRDTNVKEITNSFIIYNSQVKSFGELETYIFFSVIDKSKRIISSNTISLDLAKQDYAVQVDPDNTERARTHLGCTLNLKDDFIQIHNFPMSNINRYTSAKAVEATIKERIENHPSTYGLDIKDAFNIAFNITHHMHKADIIITKQNVDIDTDIKDDGINKSQVVLHPGRDGEQIQELLF